MFKWNILISSNKLVWNKFLGLAESWNILRLKIVWLPVFRLNLSQKSQIKRIFSKFLYGDPLLKLSVEDRIFQSAFPHDQTKPERIPSPQKIFIEKVLRTADVVFSFLVRNQYFVVYTKSKKIEILAYADLEIVIIIIRGESWLLHNSRCICELREYCNIRMLA